MKLQTQFAINTGMIAFAICVGGVCCYLGWSHYSLADHGFWLAATALGLTGTWRVWLTGQRVTRDLEELRLRARCVASGDFSGAPLALTSCAELERLGAARNATTARLQRLTNALVNISEALNRNFGSMRVVGDGMHQRIDHQSQQTQQAAAAMTEMSASIGEVSRHTQDAAQTARDASQTARDGGVIVSRVLEAIEKIAAGVTETSNAMGLLGKDSMKISQIVTVIDDIAKKTNLLALNAAIEAARAGEQGRGFAVVAVEVRRLAVSTAKATGEISSMIENIQQRASAAVANTEVGTAKVSEGLATTKQAGAALERIIGMADRVDRMIAQIAIATAQQAAAADQSSASLDAIHALSGDNLNDMATSAQGIDSLRSAASDLKLEVERLFIPIAPAGRAIPQDAGTLEPAWGQG